MAREAETGQWVLLCYRLPREPSTPRITVWRTLKRLGMAQLCDGLVTLPADARTREQLEWIAEEIVGAGGDGSTWLAHPTSIDHEQALARRMAGGRAGEYVAVITEVATAAAGTGSERRCTGKWLRAELRRIARRDYFRHRSAPPRRPRCAGCWRPTRTGNPPARRPGRCSREVGHPQRDTCRPGRPRLADPPLHRPRFDMRDLDLSHHTGPDEAVDRSFEERYEVPEAPGLDVILRGMSMTCDDERTIELTGPVFDGLSEYHRRAMLLGREPA